ncbi:MAG: SLC13 family permease [Akkermansiaceae bacterium]|nr:SLC13 family permease [Akkermansiaceae bacterium]
MTWEIIAVYIILAVTVGLFVSDRLRPDIVGLLIMAVLGLLGILKPKELLEGFGNQALITIAAMFVLSAGLMRSGIVAALGGKLTDLSRGSPLRFLVLSLVTVCFMSAFINNTPVVVVFIPAVLTVCSRMGQSPSKFLMPISFASMLGGSCTLIGTSSNILVSSLSEEAGYGEIGMFEFTGVGLVVVTIGMLYLVLFSQRLLPNRTTIASTLSADDVKEYITQVRIGPESHLVGHTLADTPLSKAGVKVAELIRGDRIQRLDSEMVLEVDDILLVRGDLNKILELDREHEISISADAPGGTDEVKRVEMTLFELMIAPESRLIGRTCREIGMREEYGISVFALQRRGRHHQREIAELDLRMGDILLVRGTMGALEKLRNNDAFILLEGVHEEVIERHKAPVALATIIAIVVLAALSIFPISVLALAGSAILVLGRVLTPRDAYRAIDWPVLVLIAGMIALGNAMEKTEAVDVAAAGLMSAVGDLGPTGTLWIFYFITAALSLLILNKPAAVLCTPLGIELALQLDVAAKPFIMAVAFAAATAMATPMGYQTNLLVYGPGGYNYRDFVTFGMPLNIGVGVVICLLIPLIWPF